MYLRDEIFRIFTADGTAPRPERSRLRFKEENYSEKKWQKTMEVGLFYVYGSVHRWSILIIVQRDATQSILLFCEFTLHVSGVNHTNHQEYTKL